MRLLSTFGKLHVTTTARKWAKSCSHNLLKMLWQPSSKNRQHKRNTQSVVSESNVQVLVPLEAAA